MQRFSTSIKIMQSTNQNKSDVKIQIRLLQASVTVSKIKRFKRTKIFTDDKTRNRKHFLYES